MPPEPNENRAAARLSRRKRPAPDLDLTIAFQVWEREISAPAYLPWPHGFERHGARSVPRDSSYACDHRSTPFPRSPPGDALDAQGIHLTGGACKPKIIATGIIRYFMRLFGGKIDNRSTFRCSIVAVARRGVHSAGQVREYAGRRAHTVLRVSRPIFAPDVWHHDRTPARNSSRRATSSCVL